MNRSVFSPHRLALVLPLAAIWLLALAMLLHANETDAQLSVRQAGWLTIRYGDPQPGSLLPARIDILLEDARGNTLARLAIPDGEARPYYGQQVEVSGIVLDSGQTTGLPPLLAVTDVRRLTPDAASATVQTSGAQPWLNVLCKFADVSATPYPPAYFEQMFSSDYLGLNHYWQRLSYNQINLDGSLTTARWYTLPHPRSHYIAPGTFGANLNLLADDCAAVADADVYFPGFVGINFIFNEQLDCCAWGGGRTMTLDNERRFYRMTWLPPWGQRHDVIAHEMGHGFGMPHSTGPAHNPPSELNVYVSNWDVMSRPGGQCRVLDNSRNSCLSQGTIAYHRWLTGWLPDARIAIVPRHTSATLTLDRLIAPATDGNPLMAYVVISDTPQRFYTVEVRDLNEYDQNIPARAVVIHDVDMRRQDNGGQAYVVNGGSSDNPNDEGAVWRVGESYDDALNGIRIDILSEEGSSFTIRVNNSAALIAGVVRDAEDQTGLPDAEVMAYAADADPATAAPNAVTTTNPDGSYTLILAPGVYQLIAHAAGYTAAPYPITPLTVPEQGALTGIDFALNRMPAPPVNLLNNPGFEDAGAQPRLPAGWVADNLNRDRRICVSPTGLQRAYAGDCAFQIVGVRGVVSRLFQRVTPQAQTGDRLRLSAWVEGRSVQGASIFALITYTDGSTARLPLPVDALNATYDYRLLSAERELRAPVRQVRVVLRTANGSGRLRVDDIALHLLPAEPSTLLSLPAAPADGDLRGLD